MACSSLLAALPASLFQTYAVISSCVETYKCSELLAAPFSHPDPFVPCTLLMLLAAAACFIFSLPTDNLSMVDCMWSLIPSCYLFLLARDDLYVVSSSFKTQGTGSPHSQWDVRLLVQAALVACWSARLTYNFARKGGYRLSFEDYRWVEVRKLMPAWLFPLFNLLFIALAQHLLILLFVSPAYVSWLNRNQKPWNVVDALATVLFVLFLAGETIADQQQWVFQSEKHRRIQKNLAREGDYRRGFLTCGLFKYSRHPNFFCEQSIWWSFYLFSVGASGCWLNWSVCGAVGLTVLFHFSTWFTEKISAEKYPAYTQYQKTTSRLLPWLPGKALSEKFE